MNDNIIQLFKPYFREEEILSEIRECLNLGWTGLGFKTIEFEEAFKAYSNFGNAHFLNSATAGLELAVKILKEKRRWIDGDEVISTALTFVSTNHAIVSNGLVPVFADVDEGLCLDLNSVESLVSSRTKAVMFVGLGGNIGQYKQLLELCRAKGLALILDAAHMAGTKVPSTRGMADSSWAQVGADADVAVFSFQAVKNLPTADSGMICFMDPEMDERARTLSWLGIDKDTFARSTSQGTYKWDYDVVDIGFKSHGNSIMASMGLVALRYLDDDNKRRRDMCEKYINALTSNEAIQIVPHEEGCLSSRHLMQVRVLNRDKVIESLARNNIYPGVHYKDNTMYKIYSSFRGNCPNARKASEEIISLPLHLGLAESDIERVISTLQSVVGQ